MLYLFICLILEYCWSEIFRHKTSHMVLSIIFLEDKHKILLHLSIFHEYQQFFQHRICFLIQPPDYSDPWPRLAHSTSFFSWSGEAPTGNFSDVFFILDKNNERPDWMTDLKQTLAPHGKKMHVKEIYVIFIHLFDYKIVSLIINL
jgi:hypothetical protein